MPNVAMRLEKSPCDREPAWATALAWTSAARLRVGSTTTGGNPFAVRYWLTSAATARASPVLVATR